MAIAGPCYEYLYADVGTNGESMIAGYGINVAFQKH